ncbi:hypothetical protein [Lachnospira multipara]|uniref:WxL domain surface cell wall-binding n=1 Tax=Lachnospira multipara TaxID=28051 RepID=A0A1H5WYF9_9FIRM|nr:hypothetical protein [Lachnospira multipara]SEG04057.1 hypothetical protein SAMN05216537_11930 [Lachnospira multipara]
MKKNRKIIAFGLFLTIFLLPIINTPVFAGDNIEYQTKEYSTNDTGQTSVSVTAYKASTVQYRIPTSINLNATGTTTFDVGVKGEIASNQVIAINEPDTFELKNTSTNETAQLNITNNSMLFSPSDINNNSFTTKTASINLSSVDTLTPGTWKGQFVINFNLK